MGKADVDLFDFFLLERSEPPAEEILVRAPPVQTDSLGGPRRDGNWSGRFGSDKVFVVPTEVTGFAEQPPHEFLVVAIHSAESVHEYGSGSRSCKLYPDVPTWDVILAAETSAHSEIPNTFENRGDSCVNTDILIELDLDRLSWVRLFLVRKRASLFIGAPGGSSVLPAAKLVRSQPFVTHPQTLSHFQKQLLQVG